MFNQFQTHNVLFKNIHIHIHERYYFAKTPEDTYRTGEPPELKKCDFLKRPARHFKIVHGEADCKFVGPPAKTPTRLVVYKKESSIPQEVMYLSTSSGTSTCAAGKWLVQKASDDDYVDAQLGYFELKGQTLGFFLFIPCAGMSQLKKEKRVPLSFYFRLDGRCRTSLH